LYHASGSRSTPTGAGVGCNGLSTRRRSEPERRCADVACAASDSAATDAAAIDAPIDLTNSRRERMGGVRG
jgi:hypothetical protein